MPTHKKLLGIGHYHLTTGILSSGCSEELQVRETNGRDRCNSFFLPDKDRCNYFSNDTDTGLNNLEMRSTPLTALDNARRGSSNEHHGSVAPNVTLTTSFLYKTDGQLFKFCEKCIRYEWKICKECRLE